MGGNVAKARGYEAEWADALVQEATRSHGRRTWLCWFRHSWQWGPILSRDLKRTARIYEDAPMQEKRCRRCGKSEWRTKAYLSYSQPWMPAIPPESPHAR